MSPLVTAAAVVTLIAVSLLVVGLAALAFVGAVWLWRQVEGARPALAPRRPMSEEELESKMNAIAEQAKSGNESLADEWREEKLAEGWDEEQIQAYLDSRPLLELS